MNTSMRVEDAPIAGVKEDNPGKTGLLFRTFLFISIHLAFLGAGVLLTSS